MPDWESSVDKAIRAAMDEGGFNNLPGTGQPLRLDDDAYTPPDLQLAYKILRDNDLAPDWIVQSKLLATQVDDWQARVQQSLRTPGNPATWAQARQQLAAQADKLNRAILGFNLKLPPGIPHRPLLNLERLIDRLNNAAMG
jgi:Domain of unknown function (DUF1992)